jgi:hypothetical protein
MIKAHFSPVFVDNHPYTVEQDSRGERLWETENAMEKPSHLIVKSRHSTVSAAAAAHDVHIRRLILMGLATAMAIATLAPIVVLTLG